MHSKTRFTLTKIAVLMVFAFSALWTVPALADESTPPPPDTTIERLHPWMNQLLYLDSPALPELLDQVTGRNRSCRGK